MARRGWPGGPAAAALVAVLTAVPAPAQAERSAGPEPTPTADPTGHEHSHEHSHDAPAPEGVDPTTRALVLGGFGLVNVTVIGSAVLLRRRDRRAGHAHGSRQSLARR